MELKNGKISIFKLFLYAAKAANQAFGTVLFAAILLALLAVLGAFIVGGIIFLTGSKNFLASSGASLVVYLLYSFFTSFLSLVFAASVVQILAARFEKTGISAPASLRDCILPAVYFFVSSLLLSVGIGLIIFAASLSHSFWVFTFTLLAVALASLPFVFTLQAIVLRNEGPISALRYSWELGVRHYGRIFLTGLSVVGLFAVLLLAVLCLAKALLPAEASSLFSPLGVSLLPMLLPSLLLELSLMNKILIVVVALAIHLYVMLFLQGVTTGLFLNLDFCDRATQNRELEALAQANAAAQEEARRPATVTPDVGVKKASVRTDSEDAAEQHLDQVYNAQEHLARALEQEEDRMPTILFDEDMAKQLAENEEKMRQTKEASAKRKEEDDGQRSIKISDKPL